MRHLKILFIGLVLIIFSISILNAQYDRKQVLLNQAKNYDMMRDYNLASDIYKELIKDYSNDLEVVEGYLSLLIKMNKNEEAEKLLTDSESILPPETYTHYSVIFLLGKGEINKAKKRAQDYLAKNSGDINAYKEFSVLFEARGEYEIAVELLLSGRKVAKDENLFTIEAARNYEYQKRYRESIDELIKHLSRNPGYLSYIVNRVKTFLTEDSNLLSVLKKNLEGSSDPLLMELLAQAYSHTENYDEALSIYRKLGADKVLGYFKEAFNLRNFELMEKAYEVYFEFSIDAVARAEISVIMAEFYYMTGKLVEAKNLLIPLLNDEDLQNRKVRYKTQANRMSRELLANISIREGKEQSEVIKWYEDAKNYAYNENDKGDIELKIIKYLIVSDNFPDSETRLNKLMAKEKPGTHLNRVSHYYYFILDLAKNYEASDSLLAEMIIADPGSEATSEALSLANKFKDMPKEQKKLYLKAHLLKSSYLFYEGYQLLEKVAVSMLNEDLLFEEADLSAALGLYEKADSLYSRQFEDDTLSGYSKYRQAVLRSDNDLSNQEVITEFLKEHPAHIFSPYMRQMLKPSSKTKKGVGSK
jgi:hypothetical protein